MGMRVGNLVRDADPFKERIQSLIFSSPIRLNSKDFATKLPFGKALEVMKALKYFRFMTQHVNPRKFAVIIDKANIIIMMSNRSGGRAPYI
jgi:hypothetical protein